MEMEINIDTFYCKNCINHKGCISVEIGDDGVCNHCKNPSKYFVVSISQEMKLQKHKEMDEIIENLKISQRKNRFDCIVGFSGGKDSTYLLYLLSVIHKLNVLAVTINSGYMNKVAFQNIKQTVSKLGVDHILVEPPIEVYTKLYKWLILNFDSNELPLMKPICDTCTDMLDGLVIKEAARRKIPYVFIGFSPDENARYFFEIPHEKLSHSWMPEYWNSDFFTDEERKWWWNPEEFGSENIPRVILPLHVWPYDEKEVIATVESEGLVRKGKADPLKTNCIVIFGLGMYDILRFGFHMYRIQLAKLVRQGSANRDHWLDIFNRLEPLVAKAEFNKQQAKRFFEQIGIAKEQIQGLAEKRRNGDPNREKIEIALKLKNII